MANIQHDDVKAIIEKEQADFYLIIFVKNNGEIQGWNGTEFEIVIQKQSDFSGDFNNDFGGSQEGFTVKGFVPFPKEKAKVSFNDALTSAQNQPDDGFVGFCGLPSFPR